MSAKIPVAILGATGAVGQRFVQLLVNHPWFEIKALVASERSEGKTYREAVSWRLDTPLPESVGNLPVLALDPSKLSADVRIAFSGLDSKVAGPAEEECAAAGIAVISNAKNHRMDPDVPLLLPEVNSDHLTVLEAQRARRGFHSGCIVTNSNCSTMTLCLALAPLARTFGLEQVLVTTLQAVSGAGYPGVASLDILGNVIPYIADEEAKIETETGKILGSVKNGSFVSHPVRVSATTTRVPVIDGHTEIVHVKLTKRPSRDEVCDALAQFRSVPQELGLPSAPERPVIVLSDSDRPQPRLDVNRERGMASIVGRVRECSLFDYKFVVLGHNTIRGAAGGAILNAELLKVYKLI